MRRACKVTLKFATATKRRKIAALLEAYRAAVNFYIQSLWNDPGKLDAVTLHRLEHSRLSQRYQSQALKQALEIVAATKRSAQALGKPATMPVYRGPAVLDAKFVTLEEGWKSFDLILRLSVLRKGARITIPTRRTRVLNKWMSYPGARLVQGCALSEEGIILWVEIPDEEPRSEGRVLGIDIGVNKLLSDSEGHHYGTDFKRIRDKIRRRKPGSKGRQRAFRERENSINATLNQLPWAELRVLGVEALHDMKRGKQKGRGRSFRKAIAPWTYRRVLNRAQDKTTENRVRLVENGPANTSRECPQCGTVRKENRKGETFRCVHCGYTADADTVGAVNVLARTLATLGSVESPRPARAMIRSLK
jgi:putative transposase